MTIQDQTSTSDLIHKACAGLLTAEQVARHFQVKVSTVRHWVAHGTIPSIKIGGARRFDLGAILASLGQKNRRQIELSKCSADEWLAAMRQTKLKS